MEQVAFIVWRESVEALLVVGILYSWLRASPEGRRGLPWLWGGVGAGLLLAGALALVLLGISSWLSDEGQEWFQALMALAACGLVVQMVVWMRAHGRGLKRELESGAGIEVGLPRAFRRLRQELHQQAAGAPAMLRLVAIAAAPFLADREPHLRRNLLRTQKIFVCGVLEAATLQRHQPLIAAHVRALIDGHGEMAMTEQRAGIRCLAEPRLVEPRIGAQPVRRLKIDDQERHRSVGLGLQDEAAVELERGAEQRRQHDGFAEQLADRRRIVVTGQQLVERGAEPGQPPTQVERTDLERDHRVIDGNCGGSTDGGFGRRIWNGDV